MSEQSPAPLALRQRREATIARLCEHFAVDHLEAEELEQLIDRAHRAQSLEELDALLSALPALPTSLPARERPADTDDHQMVVAVMGGAERKGGWRPARRVYVTAVMGGAVLDFRHAHIAAGLTEVYVLAIMGGVEIVVPPEVHVESNGVGIMGGFGHTGQGRFPVDSSVPVLRVTGVAVMGGVEIHERPRGGSSRELGRAEKHRLERGEPRDGSGWVP